VITWADLEKQFHKYFFSGVHEKKITDLVKLRQRNDESVEGFVQRIREVKNKCYSLVLDDRQLADLAFQGLLPHIRDKYASQEFESLSHLVQRISDQDIKPFEPKRAWNKKVSFVDEATSSDSDEETSHRLGRMGQKQEADVLSFWAERTRKVRFRHR
jgi:hypothetical protein